jgi:hypothetical protein
MEKLLHYTWKHRLFPLSVLKTTTGEGIEILDTGLSNQDEGPDFFNAKVKMDGVVWSGNVEIHLRSSDWYRHGHHLQPEYDSVILHVVEKADGPVLTSKGESIPQLELPIPAVLQNNYEALLHSDRYPPCYPVVRSLPALSVHSWMNTLQTERLEQKTTQLNERVKRCDGNWEDALFVTLARNFGFGVNSDAFEHWAYTLPLRAADKHRDSIFQIEALFFGQAGFLEEAPSTDGKNYYDRLQQEYRYLAHKFSLPPVEAPLWRFLRLRPGNFPQVRIAQLAALYFQAQGLLSRLLEAETLLQVFQLLKVTPSAYWSTHYRFGESSPNLPKSLSTDTLRLLVINSVVPFLFAYGRRKNREELVQRAETFLEQLPAEKNHILRLWQECGLEAKHAGDSQALLQLKKNYCDTKRCLYCRIGYQYLKRSVERP